MKVAIQGQRASFHDIATRKFFGDAVDIIVCDDFAAVFSALANGSADRAVVALENSLFGSINEVYDLVLTYNAWIIGEVYLRVQQCLIGLPGSKLNDITEVYSHPVALAQCTHFLDSNLPKAQRFESHDTAGSVTDINEWRKNNKAAIASRVAADINGMEVIADEIETHKQNYTRFAILSRTEEKVAKANKCSLVLTTDHKAGALYRALGVFAEQNINLTKLQSRPIVGQAWHYMFYIDAACALDTPVMQTVLRELQAQRCAVTVLGSYSSINI